MSGLSEHTKLLNKMIALSMRTADFPKTLMDNGYVLECIEPRFLIADGSQIALDLQFMSLVENNILFVECKDGGVEKDQLNRYKKVGIEDLKRQKISAVPTDKLKFDLGYIGSNKSKIKLLDSIQYDANPFPILISYPDKICLTSTAPNIFQSDKLNAIFQNLSCPSYPPSMFLPFTVDDSDYFILPYILTLLATKTNTTFTVNQIIHEIFGNALPYFSKDAEDALKSRVGRMIKEIAELPELKEILFLKDGQWFIKARSMRSYQSACNKLVDKYRDEQSTPKLTQFMD